MRTIIGSIKKRNSIHRDLFLVAGNVKFDSRKAYIESLHSYFDPHEYDYQSIAYFDDLEHAFDPAIIPLVETDAFLIKQAIETLKGIKPKAKRKKAA